MSLTNPNSVVTEERLSEFYQGILPYLGGMPDILANKFDKANMFSTDEKIIGQWIDGKPLYQKVFVSSNAFAIGTSWINTGWDISFANVLVNTQIIDSVGQVFCGVNAGFISGNLGLQAFNTISNAKICILQYTKTTDSPVEIGIDTDYSTTEKIVGTWIDGKPLYQKTIEFTNRIIVPSATWLDSGATVENGGIVVNSFAIYDTSNPVPWVTAKIDTNKLYLNSAVNNSGIDKITIQYTKTTD